MIRLTQLNATPVFRKGVHQLSVINTDLVEAEALIKKLAAAEKRLHPEAFAGLEPCVYFKMPYIQPCDTFKELRRLILRIRENTGLRANYKGIVAIEVTDWIGHEREEYFTVLLKFLYDHHDIWQAALILNDSKPGQLQKFLSACVRYITPKLFDIKLFDHVDSLIGVIQSEFTDRKIRISHAAAAMLAEAMIRPELKDARSLTFIERTVAEVISFNDGRQQVSVGKIKDYLTEEWSTLSMMAGKVLYEERGATNESEALQL